MMKQVIVLFVMLSPVLINSEKVQSFRPLGNHLIVFMKCQKPTNKVVFTQSSLTAKARGVIHHFKVDNKGFSSKINT